MTMRTLGRKINEPIIRRHESLNTNNEVFVADRMPAESIWKGKSKRVIVVQQQTNL